MREVKTNAGGDNVSIDTLKQKKRLKCRNKSRRNKRRSRRFSVACYIKDMLHPHQSAVETREDEGGRKKKTWGIRWKILKKIKSSTVLLKSEKPSARGGQEGKPNIP